MKKAFTMIELLVVMVVGAILSAVAISKIHTSELIDAARSVANDIRYVRILALGDDLYGVPNYHGEYYRIRFNKNLKSYKIINTPHKNIIVNDYIDSSKLICDDSKPECVKRANLLNNFGVEISKFIPSKTSIHKNPENDIIFNELGEPLNYDPTSSGFQIELKKNSEKVCISVAEFTGFIEIEKEACK